MVRGKGEIGVYVVFLAIFFAAALMLAAIVIAVGFMSVNRATYGNTVNSASLAALERYMRSQETDNAAREAEAIASANSEILSLSPLKSFGPLASLGQLSAEGQGGKGGEVLFGEWKTSPQSTQEKCDSGRRDEFPCFVPGSASVNAVKIIGKTPEPLKIPFAHILGAQNVALQTEAIAAVVPRCIAFVLDASLTATEQTHKAYTGQGAISWHKGGPWMPASGETDPLTDPLCQGAGGPIIGYSADNPPSYYACPRDATLFAFDVQELLKGGTPGKALFDAATSPCLIKNGPFYNNQQRRRWCDLSFENGIWRTMANRNSLVEGGRAHFVEHYKPMTTVYGDMLVDTVVDPLPLYHFLSAFNAGLLLLETQSSLSDRAKIIAFKGNVFDEEPKGTEFHKSGDIGPLLQLTNPDNIKQTPAIYPNYVSRGWFGRFDERITTPTLFMAVNQTNIPGALWRAITLLADSTKCPTNARKVIVLATDGVSKCTETEDGVRYCGKPEIPGDEWATYLASEHMLIEGEDSLMHKMMEAKIIFTPLVAGSGIQPNFIDHKTPGGDESDLIDYSSPLMYDLGGNPGDTRGADYWITDPRSIAPACTKDDGSGCTEQLEIDKYAFDHFGQKDVYFRRPNGILAEMAAKTGGIYCPLLEIPLGNSFKDDYIDNDGDEKGQCEDTNCCTKCTPRILKPQKRKDKEVLVQPQRYLSSGEQAAMCVVESIGLNPFSLVKED